MKNEFIESTAYVLYAPGYGFLYGNRLSATRDFSKARLFTKKHFAKNSLSMQSKEHRHKISEITPNGEISEIKILPVTISVKSEDVFMSELGGNV